MEESYMEFETIKRNTTPQMIVKQIIATLEEGNLKPGDKLPPERKLCEMFGVGRSSIREAIKALVVMGYLEVIQGKGTFISNNFPNRGHSARHLEKVLAEVSLDDLLESREILECQVIRLAAGRIKKNQIKKLKSILAVLKNTEQRDADGFFLADKEFHDVIIGAAGNIVMGELMQVIRGELHEYGTKLVCALNVREKSIKSCEKIITYLESGKGDKAAEWMVYHLDVVRDTLEDLVNKEGERGEGLKV